MLRFVTTCAAVLLALLPAPLHAAGPPFPPPDYARARALAVATPTANPYVFAGEAFPEIKLDLPAEVKDRLGLGEARVEVYESAHLRPVKKPTAPGPYLAVVDIEDGAGRVHRRYLTLYALGTAISPEKVFGPGDLAELARAAGLDEGALRRESALVQGVLTGRPFGQWSRDPRAARLLAGLTIRRRIEGPIGKFNDALARERQLWVDLKRKLYGWDKTFNKPFICPETITGEAAVRPPTRASSYGRPDTSPEVRRGTPEEAGVTKDAAAKIDKVLQAFAADTDEAFAVCIVRKGVIVLHKAYGTRDGKPMTVDTKSWMASITKTMSATLMLMLIDRGLVGLDDPVDRYLPNLRGIPVKRPLTIHHLYTHTNGLTLDGWPGWADDMPDVAERLTAYYDKLHVGREWAYTGTGNMLGSKIVEAVTGEALPVAYHRHLLGPLGCTGTDVTDSHAGAFSVPLDMAKFGQLLLNRGSYGRQRYFRSETFERALPGKLDKLLGPGAKRTFGFGLDGNAKRFGHGAASAATFSVDTERQLVVIMTRNRYGKNQDKYNGMFWKAIDEAVVKE